MTKKKSCVPLFFLFLGDGNKNICKELSLKIKSTIQYYSSHVSYGGTISMYYMHYNYARLLEWKVFTALSDP